jgi:hypothetical protein
MFPGFPLRAPLQVDPDPARPGQKNKVPIYASNLVGPIASPDVTEVETLRPVDGKIPFTLEPLGYPLLDLRRRVAFPPPAEDPEAAARAVAPMLDRAVRDWPMGEQIFSPVFRWPRDYGLVHRSLSARNQAFIAPAAWKRSGDLGGLAHGQVRRVETKTDDDAFSPESLAEALTSALLALEFDPNNVNAWLWAARACAQRRDWEPAMNLLLTLVCRLRVVERILADPSTHRDAVLLRHVVTRSMQEYLIPYYFSLLQNTAAMLALRDKLDLQFPHVAQCPGSG